MNPIQLSALEVTNSDGNTWWVDPALVLAIRAKTKGFGAGIPEVGRLSMRADYLTLEDTTELKTSARIKALKYVQSAQRLRSESSWEWSRLCVAHAIR